MSHTEKSEKAATLVDRDDAVIVAIDLQEKLLPAIHEGEKVVENTHKLLQAGEIMEIPVILTEQIKLGDTADGLANLPEPVEKESFNCFSNNKFSNRLKDLGRNTLILAGIEAHICVAQTALGAVEGYNVHLVADATSSRNEENKDLGIARCRSEGVTITSTEMVIYELLERAGTEEFREVLPIVK